LQDYAAARAGESGIGRDVIAISIEAGRCFDLRCGWKHMDEIATVQHPVGAVGTLSAARLPAVRPYGKNRAERRAVLLSLRGRPLP